MYIVYALYAKGQSGALNEQNMKANNVNIMLRECMLSVCWGDIEQLDIIIIIATAWHYLCVMNKRSITAN